MAKSPAFQFYPNDYLGSTKVNLMTLEEQGAYVRLMCHTWGDDNCSLNNDDTELAMLSGLGDKWMQGSGDKIKKCFNKKGKRLVHPRLLIEREKQNSWRDKCKKAGMASGKARRNKELKPNVSSSHVEHKTNSSVCSLQSSTSVKDLKKGASPVKRFIKPTIEELTAYCKEKKYTVNPESFMAFYDSNGWKVGKNPMKNWKSALVTWKNRERPAQQSFARGGDNSGDMLRSLNNQIREAQKRIETAQKNVKFETEGSDEWKRYMGAIKREEADIAKLREDKKGYE